MACPQLGGPAMLRHTPCDGSPIAVPDGLSVTRSIPVSMPIGQATHPTPRRAEAHDIFDQLDAGSAVGAVDRKGGHLRVGYQTLSRPRRGSSLQGCGDLGAGG